MGCYKMLHYMSTIIQCSHRGRPKTCHPVLSYKCHINVHIHGAHGTDRSKEALAFDMPVWEEKYMFKGEDVRHLSFI